MPLPSPNLDDRTFEQLVEGARKVITSSAPEWNDLSEGDPGIALMEAFAYLADATIYRLNRVPDKLFVEFLRLIGVRLQPPSAAIAMLRFTRDPSAPAARIEIPRGTRVTLGEAAGEGEPPVFATLELARLEPTAASVDVRAIHADLIEGELLGTADGQAGLSFSVRRPPIIAPSGDPLDLLVGVEADPGEIRETETAIEFDGRSYLVWREVDDFSELGPEDTVYIADRAEGTILLAPAARVLLPDGSFRDDTRALAAVPRSGRQVRAWYRRGGGQSGNVAASSLTALRDAIPALNVTNLAPATGGREAEPLANALVRGPQDLHSLSRAVTARDFQLVAQRSSGSIARAHAFTQAALWQYATPGTVELVLVPALPDPALASGVTAEQLHGLETQDALTQVQRAIDERRPLGTSCLVNWANYKTVRVKATIVVQREEDVAGVRQRVDERLHLSVNPLPTDRSAGGWPFGQALYASNIYKIVLSEPGVRYARGVRIHVDEVPDQKVAALEADAFQPNTWYAGSGGILFRSLNDGDGWEPMGRFSDEIVQVARVHPEMAGLLAVATIPATGSGSSIHVSWDSGETWPFTRHFGFRVRDVAWLTRDGAPLLLMATGAPTDDEQGKGGGLYQIGVTPGADPVQVIVDPTNQDLPFYAVAAVQEVRGEVSVAVAAQSKGGVFLSSDGGRGNSFRPIGLKEKDVRVLAIQRDGPRSWLWAGTASPGGEANGEGCFRRELLGAEDPPGWDPFGPEHGWDTGTCWDLAFAGGRVLAATQQAGVLDLDSTAATPAWKRPNLESSGLPVRDFQSGRGTFQPVNAVAADPSAQRVMAGGPLGVYRTSSVPPDGSIPVSTEPGALHYESCKEQDFAEEVTLPPTWLFVCGANELEVVGDASS
jgi:hypothetical protein